MIIEGSRRSQPSLISIPGSNSKIRPRYEHYCIMQPRSETKIPADTDLPRTTISPTNTSKNRTKLLHESPPEPGNRWVNVTDDEEIPSEAAWHPALSKRLTKIESLLPRARSWPISQPGQTGLLVVTCLPVHHARYLGEKGISENFPETCSLDRC